MPDNLEWDTSSGEEIVYRHPKDRIGWGDILVVKQNQIGVFMKDGKAFDVFGPGRYVMKTNNIPLLTKVLSTIAGYEKTPFQAELIFLSISEFKGKFGGRSQTQELAPAMFNGEFFYKISDPQVFCYEIVGNQSIYTTMKFNEFFRSYLIQECISQFAKKSIVNLMNDLQNESKSVQTSIKEELGKRGINLLDLRFLSVDTTPDYRDRLFFMRAGVSADKVATLGATKDVASSLGKGGGGNLATFGVGAQLFPQMFSMADKAKETGNVEQHMLKCNQCGAAFAPTAKFCPSCGDPTDDELKGSSKFCTNCGTQVGANSKFCPSCGSKIS